MTRALSVRRVAAKSALGLVSRGSQGTLLLLAVPTLSDAAGGDLALVLGIAATLNLVSNVGIPTLIIRGFRQGQSGHYLISLARAYVLMSMFAGSLSGLVVWVLASSVSLAACAALLATAQSVYHGLEYWVLGSSTNRYDVFLVKGATIQAGLSAASPIIVLATRDGEYALVALSLSYVFGALSFVLAERVRVRRILGYGLMLREWWRTAVGLGTVTALTGALYSVDLFVVRTLAADSLIDYRLALNAISFVVALLPLNLFVLADAASGLHVRGLRLAQMAALSAGCCVAGGWILTRLPEYEEAGQLLLLLALLSAARLVTQVQIGQLNAQGLHNRVSAALVIGLFAWGIVLVLVTRNTVSVLAIASGQLVVEWGVVCYLLISASRHARLVRRAPRE